MIYLVSSHEDAGGAGDELAAIVETVRENTAVPCVVDGGSFDTDEIRDKAAMADGVVIGLPIIDLLAKYGKNAPEHIGAYIGQPETLIDRAGMFGISDAQGAAFGISWARQRL